MAFLVAFRRFDLMGTRGACQGSLETAAGEKGAESRF